MPATGRTRARAGTVTFALVVAILIAIAGLVYGSGQATPVAAAKAKEQKRPNIVLLESDDQALESMRFMPKTERLIGDRGATFPVNIASWPLCCPSRATLFTGQYAHNHGVLGNRGTPLGGFDRLKLKTAMPVWMENAGYYTAHIGKYLNGYEDSEVGVPPGWTEWHGSKDTYKFYGYKLLENGEIVQYGDPEEDPDNPAHPETYSTDVYTDKAVDVIQRRAPSNKPFFLSLAYLAPHSGAPQPSQNSGPSACVGTAKPAIRHLGALADVPTPHPPNFDEADTTDKPKSIRKRNPLSDTQLEKVDRNYHCRAESLLALDESVERIIKALRDSGELENTLVIYTSDNGFFHGEHRIPNGKNRVYEEAAKVPLLMRGPGVPAGVTVKEMGVNADLAVTFADVANAKPLVKVDGRSLIPLAQKPDRYRGREILMEQYSALGEDGEPRGGQYSAIRTERYKYVDNSTGELELYDLEKDPYELQNQAGNPAFAAIQSNLAKRLKKLRKCKGSDCRLKPLVKLKLTGKQPETKASKKARKKYKQAKAKAKKGERPKKPKRRYKNCFKPGSVKAKVRQAKEKTPLDEVQFHVDDRRSGSDGRAPFQKKLRAKLLKGKKKRQISADAELLDGRILTLSKKAKICR